jgi:hypothetical protein
MGGSRGGAQMANFTGAAAGADTGGYGAQGGAGGAAPGFGGPGAYSAGGAVSGAVDTGGNTLAYHDVVVVRDFPENLAVIDEIVKRVDVQPPQVLIEAVILSVELRDTQQLGVNFSVVDNLERLALVSGSANAINAAAGFPPSRVLTTAGKLVAGYAVPDQGLRFGFISDTVSGFIRTLETFNKTNILASPRILVLNKQRADIQLGQRLGFRNTVTNLTSSLQVVDFLSVGTLLSLRPYVATDGMIRMEIHPEKSTGRLDDQGIPQTNTSELTTNILVPDGATIVIGGLIDDQDDVVQDGIPGLSRLKHLGFLFRNRTTFTRKTELIVLLTPRILRRGGLPEPVPGVAPHGPMGVPNSGPMPGPSLPITGEAFGLPAAPLVPEDEPPPNVPQLLDPGVLVPGPDDIIPPPGFAPPGTAAPAARPVPAARPAPAAPIDEPTPPPPPAPMEDPTIRSAPAAPIDEPAAPIQDPAARQVGATPGRWHRVSPGESLRGLAAHYYGSEQFEGALWRANQAILPRPGDLRAGMTIAIPPRALLDAGAGAEARPPGGYRPGSLSRALVRRLRPGAAAAPEPAQPRH